MISGLLPALFGSQAPVGPRDAVDPKEPRGDFLSALLGALATGDADSEAAMPAPVSGGGAYEPEASAESAGPMDGAIQESLHAATPARADAEGGADAANAPHRRPSGVPVPTAPAPGLVTSALGSSRSLLATLPERSMRTSAPGPLLADARPEEERAGLAPPVDRERERASGAESARDVTGLGLLQSLDLRSVVEASVDRGTIRVADADVERSDSPERASAAGHASAVLAKRAAPASGKSAALAPLSVTDRSWDRLDPEMKVRLEHVIERMDAEHGHRVELIEGYRTPERQAYLFAQGRSRPGPVVTWTRDSEHSSGRAVDLLVDGRIENTSGYERLQRVALQEGLATLGMSDPGHLELTTEGRSAERRPVMAERSSASAPAAGPPATASRAPLSPMTGSRGSDDILRVASVAITAAVSAVAPVTRLAQVARPGRSAPSTEARRSPAPASTKGAESREPVSDPWASPARTDAAAVRAVPPSTRMTSGVRRGASALDRVAPEAKEPSGPGASKPRRDRRSTTLPRPSVEPLSAMSSDRIARGGSRPAAGPEVGVTGASALRGVEKVLEAQELAAAVTPGRVSIRLDGAEGSTNQVRVGFLGRTVDADLDISDPEIARAMRARVSELYGALERRGFEVGRVGIGLAGSEASVANGWALGSDTTADLLRTILGHAPSDAGRPESERGAGNRYTDGNGDGDSQRPRKDHGKEKRNAS